MTTAETVLHPAAIVAEIKKNHFTHVVWLPDSETNFLFQLLTNEPSLDLIPVCREGETMAIAAGLWVGGKKPLVLIQNTGIYESGRFHPGVGPRRQPTSVDANRLSGMEPTWSHSRFRGPVH